MAIKERKTSMRPVQAQLASAQNNTTQHAAHELTPLRKPGITSGIFQPARLSQPLRRFPRLL